MNTSLPTLTKTAAWALALAGTLATGQLQAAKPAALVGTSERATVAETADRDAELAAADTTPQRHEAIVIQKIEAADDAGPSNRKDAPWLGVSTEEAAEALISQLGLDPGVGLVVNYVAADSPAAQAGLQKNDVLTGFAGQALVHPAQLRKLVQVRKVGDTVPVAFYRAGRKQSVTVTLGQAAAGLGLVENDRAGQKELRDLQQQLRDLPIGETIREQMKMLRDSLGNLKIDQQKVQEEVRRSMDEARKAMREALRHATNAGAALDPLREQLEELSRAKIAVPDDATVTVRNSGSSVRSTVQADESGTIVIVNRPKLHLTAHGKDGGLLFDGEIETPDQRAKVPRALWQKVEPLLKKEAPEAEEEPASKPAAPKETSSCGARDLFPASGA